MRLQGVVPASKATESEIASASEPCVWGPDLCLQLLGPSVCLEQWEQCIQPELPYSSTTAVDT